MAKVELSSTLAIWGGGWSWHAQRFPGGGAVFGCLSTPACRPWICTKPGGQIPLGGDASYDEDDPRHGCCLSGNNRRGQENRFFLSAQGVVRNRPRRCDPEGIKPLIHQLNSANGQSRADDAPRVSRGSACPGTQQPDHRP